MKVAITGTNGGLGNALKVEFGKSPLVEIIELNRPDFDITFKSSRAFISSVPFDLFVNCAYAEDDGFAQTELLYDLFDANKDRECHIINVGSVSGDGDRHKVYPYGPHKSALEKASTQLSLVDGPCKVSLIKPGRMKTKMTDHRNEFYRMEPSIVAAAVVWMAYQPKELNVKSMTYDVHNANRTLV